MSNSNNNRTALQQLQMQIQIQMQQHRRGRSLCSVRASNSRRDELQQGSQDRGDDEDDLALFNEMNKNRGTNFLTSSEESESDLGNMNSLSRISTRKGVGDDLLSVDGDKNDYEWLLSPPPTPFFSSVDTKVQVTSFTPKGSPAARPINALRSLRPSNPHTDSSPKIMRGSLTSRQTISSGLNNSVHMASGRSSMLASPGPASSRPSTPTRSRALASSRPSTPTRSTIPASSRQSTPTTRSTIPSASRPSTPTSRSTIPTSRPTVPTSKSLSRPSTPTRRPSTPSLTQSSYGISRSSVSSFSSIPTRNPPTSRGSSPSPAPRGSSPSPAPRGSSPSPAPRPSQPPLLPPDFSIETPPNLRTTMPQRPSSVSRGRPGAPSSARPATEAPPTSSRPRGQSCSPVVTRGRIMSDSHSNGKSNIPGIRSRVNGSDVTMPLVLGSKMMDKVMGARSVIKGHEDQATTRSINSSMQSRRPVKPISSPDGSGFGRTISKKSLDMALRHMDIRQSTPSSIRPLTSIPTSSLYSVRSGSSKSKPTNISESPIATSSNGSSEHGAMIVPYPVGNVLDDYDVLKDRENILSPLSQQGSILFKGDEQSTNWLHGPENVDDKFDQNLLLPRFEPFDSLADTTVMGGDQ